MSKVLEPHEEIYRELSLKYNLSLEATKGIIKFMVKRSIDEIECKNFREIMWPYWGKYCVTRTKKWNYECHTAYIEKYGSRQKDDNGHYRSFREQFISEQKHKRDCKEEII